ncbi:bifunctional glutamate N-acetyltransferase/amino-acid acetyltransferase ArgJ [Halochromatium roseum]|uniref:bifunctional glutamate N-acetyltransferase/amino-acid acetyltransferase ArgJ n=1 Tax=Halochromatium roseum TaxID=391920 RepID=UPI001914206D|nr:bifunctional glutamate N-acetyltransferase/amino-acid acetyltransferase ArgJ [Halochromatium roseum]MBK5941036.1 bifunctional ornithine acetyltransferase/N-acetylglutamate synthase [Halochromatium roseum]
MNVGGVRLAAVPAAIRYRDRDDLVLIALAEGTRCAATFTRNAFCAAPVTVAREHLAAEATRWLLINAGNANAGTGARGLEDARTCCRALAALTQVNPAQVLPFSTGIIGEYLPLERLTAALPQAIAALDENGWDAAARAIMTTDTLPKIATRQLLLGGQQVTLTGIAKGAGMIRPDMATMLAFIATDATVTQACLQRCLSQAVDGSFNAISIDGDTSTNDACVLVATGTAGNPTLDDPASTEQGAMDLKAFQQTLNSLCEELARAIVRDGEGATKLVSIEIGEARTAAEARQVADTIAHSPLVKTALFASDPNWGRILAAVGRAGLEDLDIDKVRIRLDDVLIVSGGGRDPSYQEQDGQAVMAKDSFSIGVDLGRGRSRARLLTCDLSYDYVRINAEYRT